MNRCKTCEYWDLSKAYTGGSSLRRCANEGKLTEDYGGITQEDDMLIYPYMEGGAFYTGPEFGCVHHTMREDDE